MVFSQRQRGAALITGLIIMVILTLLAVASMRTTIMEEKMAGNARDIDIAFQSAEAAIRAGEDVLNGATLPAFSTSGAHLTAAVRNDEYWLSTHNWGTSSIAYSGTLEGTSGNPRYVIEEMAAVPESGGSLKMGAIEEKGIYRITVRGAGASPNAKVYLQSTYRR
ncbi:pilus assembly PilX family protein [Noviherbaspirillum sedimenti]|uniref:Pilus assembly protein PilX n=1 Tax=Noviherbaspirillum sedimenti TaxID=2320865 RepID=A0A3A3G6A1_9BURK|nr:PilX N-terminal domain-containing pilus assembly protein [Noviherbaspirillum sedimenti]RJG03968.1 hypothetical protein D3878_22220 [Noviherbaspirillum sedimenti]